MSNVFKLVRPSNEGTVAVMKGVANDAVLGQITGVVLCLRRSDGSEHVVVTGVYADNPNIAIGAAMQIAWEAQQARENALREAS